jgi:hypothetical protein
MIIAAVAGANECVVVTDNEKDFVGLKVVNPMRGAIRCSGGARIGREEDSTPRGHILGCPTRITAPSVFVWCL